jgi:hypothetical protein
VARRFLMLAMALPGFKLGFVGLFGAFAIKMAGKK